LLAAAKGAPKVIKVMDSRTTMSFFTLGTLSRLGDILKAQ
jgi:hypothetical protein